tara:strand:- start:1047 stop:1457 length:411 start_codon:yes stop_codon:yes gene_type:complete
MTRRARTVVAAAIPLSGCTAPHRGLRIAETTTTTGPAEPDPRAANGTVVVRRVFWLENPGDEPMEIVRVRASQMTVVALGNTTAVPPAVIAPGDRLAVTVTARNNTDRAVVRRGWLETTSGDLTLEVPVPPAATAS